MKIILEINFTSKLDEKKYEKGKKWEKTSDPEFSKTLELDNYAEVQKTWAWLNNTCFEF